MAFTRKYFSPSEVADLLGVSRSFVYQHMQKGNLTYSKVGSLARITETDIDDFIDREVPPSVQDLGN